MYYILSSNKCYQNEYTKVQNPLHVELNTEIVRMHKT